MMMRRDPTTELGDRQPASTGIEGLDEILRGGFPRDEMHLIQGASGTGKTTLALHYLLAGIRAGERGLYITLSQPRRGLETIAHSHGWSLEGMTVHELSPEGLVEHLAAHQTVLHTSEVELDELTRELRRLVEQAQPRRVVFDSIGVIGLLAGSRARYRREIVALRQFLAGRGCTALFLGDWQAEAELEGPANTEFHNLAASLLHLEQATPDYGEVRRRVRVVKVRGVPFQGGYHNFRIQTGGLEVFPRLRPYSAPEYTNFQRIQSGIEALDQLLGGGLEQGTACLLIGPPGTGKSTLASLYARAAAQGGDTAAIFLFDERPETFKGRSKSLGIDLGPHLDSGRLLLQQLHTAQITPGEFAQRVREAVEHHEARVVVIDSLTGYFNAMGGTSMLVVQMHELLNFLSRRGVLTFLVVTQEGSLKIGSRPSADISYLSDSIILMQQFEAGGTVRRCLAVIKKREGEHDTTIRELLLRPGSVSIGEPLRQFHNLLGGDPRSTGGGQRQEGGGGGAREEKSGDA